MVANIEGHEIDRDLASNRIGTLLLQGMVLTDSVCTKCHKVPTMRSKDKSTIGYCVLCDAQKESKKTKTISEKIGEKMLSGATLLAESCDTCNGVPLMCENDMITCLSCEEIKVINEDGIVSNLMSPETPLEPSTPCELKEPEMPETIIVQVDDNSSFTKSNYIVKQKIHQLTKSLAVSNDPKQTAEIFNAISFAAKALQDLNNVRSLF